MHLLMPALQGCGRVPGKRSNFPAGLLTHWVTLHITLNLCEPWFPLLIRLFNKHRQRPHYVPGAKLGIKRGQSFSPTWLTGPKPTLTICWKVHVSTYILELLPWPPLTRCGGILGILESYASHRVPSLLGQQPAPGAACHPATLWSQQPRLGTWELRSLAATASATTAATAPPRSSCLCACCRHCSFPGKCSS